MSTVMDRELLSGTTSSGLDVNNTTHRLKGFMSVEGEDRHGDDALSKGFNIDAFMAKPVLMYNHKYWYDNSGNARAIGAPRRMYAAKLVKVDNPDMWGVYNVNTKTVEDEYPKNKVPDLKAGARGVFTEVEVTVDAVWLMVERGELNAFSWRGLAEVDYRVNSDGTTTKVLNNIDIYEVSLVFVPGHGSSTFTFMKSANVDNSESNLVVQAVKLDKNVFINISKATEYLNSHGLKADDIKEDTSNFYSLQKDIEQFNISNLVTVKLCSGVQVVAGEVKSKPQSSVWVGTPLETVAKYAELWKESFMDKSDKTPQPETKQTAEEKVVEKSETKVEAKKEESVDKVETKVEPKVDMVTDPKILAQKEALDAFAAMLGGKTTEAMVAQMKPMFEGMTNAMVSMSEKMQSFAQKMVAMEAPKEVKTETKTEEVKKTETEKSVVKPSGFQEMLGALQTLVHDMKDIKKTAEDAKKTSEEIAKSVNNDTVREEKIEAPATNDKPEPNAIFDTMWPMFKKGK